MGIRTIHPKSADSSYSTVVTIEPSFEENLLMPELVYPAAFIRVESLENGKLLFNATFKKVLDETPLADECRYVDCAADMTVVQTADRLINGDLSAIGLDGLNDFDIHHMFASLRIIDILDRDTMIKIFSKTLNLPYVNRETKIAMLVPPKNGFYELEVI